MTYSSSSSATMSSENGPPFSLKVMINKHKSRVLFAEAGNDVADVLLSFLTFPVGKIVTTMEQHYGNEAPVIGSLTTLSRGLFNLDSTLLCVEGAKQILLNPRISIAAEFCCRVNLDNTDSQKIKYYFCQDLKCGKPQASNISMYSDIATCDCGKPLNRELLTDLERSSTDDGVFNMKAASFIICDDIRVVPVVSGFLQTLKNLGITDTDGAELTTFSVEIEDIFSLLKLSLTSATPLTDLIIKKTQKSSSVGKPERGVLLHHHIQKEDGDTDTRKLSLKVFLQKSTKKFLLAEATDEFVEFLFSFLALPLGKVEHLLGGKTCFKNIDNLYSSVNMIDNKYFIKSSYTKNVVINPNLAPGYVSTNQFLPLTEEGVFDIILDDETTVSSFKPSKEHRKFLKDETMYIVSDDLTVIPFSITSSLSIPNAIGVSLSDVEEMDLQIGMEEALCMLKASLWSTTVLTDALINPMLCKPMKRPKHER